MSDGDKNPARVGLLTKLLDILVKLATLAGLAFVALEYRSSIDRARVERANTYIDRFETGDIGVAVRAISREVRDVALRPDFAILRSYVASNPGTANAGREQITRLLAFDSRGGKGLSDEIDQVVSYFNSLQACVEQDLCDRKIAHGFFDDYAKNFWANFEPYVLERRQQVDPNFGILCERFVSDVPALVPPKS